MQTCQYAACLKLFKVSTLPKIQTSQFSKPLQLRSFSTPCFTLDFRHNDLFSSQNTLMVPSFVLLLPNFLLEGSLYPFLLLHSLSYEFYLCFKTFQTQLKEPLLNFLTARVELTLSLFGFLVYPLESKIHLFIALTFLIHMPLCEVFFPPTSTASFSHIMCKILFSCLLDRVID